MSLRHDVLPLLKASETPRKEQVIRVGGKHVDDMLLEANWYREEVLERNEMWEKVGKTGMILDVPDETTREDLCICTYFGRKVEIVDGDEDILEIT